MTATHCRDRHREPSRPDLQLLRPKRRSSSSHQLSMLVHVAESPGRSWARSGHRMGTKQNANRLGWRSLRFWAAYFRRILWLRGQDLNLRGYEPVEKLCTCAEFLSLHLT